MLDISLVIIILLLGFHSKHWVPFAYSQRDKNALNLLWVYHIIICIVFYVYINVNGGDARNYWFTVKIELSQDFFDYLSLGFGTYFMYALNYFPSKILDLSFITGSFIYAFIGYLGFVYFYVVFKTRIANNTKLFGINLFPFFLFLPNLHFWTAGIGKDALLFFCIAVFLYSITKPKKNFLKLLFVLVLAYLTRPHIVAFLFLSFGIGLILDGSLKIYLKMIFIVLLIGIFVYFFDTVMAYLRIEDFNMDTISNYSIDKVSKLSRIHTSSSVDISGSPFIFKAFTFLFRPLFFDINGFLAIIASIENLILLLLTIRFIKLNPFKLFFKGDYFFKSLMIFFILGTVSFSLILGNLGIMLRQKNMFIPALLFICLWGFSYAFNKKLNETKST